MIQTMPTNLPKLNTNFSIDWIVKNDKHLSNTKNSDKSMVSRTSATTNASQETLPKDYDREISTALRLHSPKTSDIDGRRSADAKTPQTDKLPLYENYREISASTEPHLVRPMPFIPAPPPQPPNAADQKLNYFEKPMHHPLSHHQHHTQQQQQQQHSLPLTPPNNGLPLDAMQQHQQFLSAQLQMAAALNYQRHASGQPQALNFSQIFSNNFHRTSYQLQPWLLNRHGRFPYGFSGDFLLHPYRKPKRIRTAFAPLQLLELENAFEGNQYVVGSERKALAKTLNLTETQVKVWFQNRRTKHKRMQQEGNNGNGNNNNNNNRSLSDDESNNFMDDEEIDIEDTDDYEDNH